MCMASFCQILLQCQVHFYGSLTFPCLSLPLSTTVLNDKARKTKENMWHTIVLFTGAIKLPNSVFCISKTTEPISTKFIYFLPCICTT